MTKRAANRKKLTDQLVRKLKPGTTVWDSFLPGFGIRCGQRSKTWIIAAIRPGSKHPVRLRLGGFPQLSVADARAKARTAMEGGAPEKPRLFGQLIDEFLADGRTRSGRPLRATSLATYRSILTVTAKPLHHLAVSDIRRRDIAELTRKVASRHSAGSAALTKATLGCFWTWCAARDLSEASPVAGSPSFQTPKGKRVLSEGEIRALWHPDDDELELILRLLFWTGARPQEIGGMSRSELAGAGWTLPEERSKNRRPLTLPLARQTVAALADWPCVGGRDFLFGVTSRKGFGNWGDAKTKLDARLRFNQPWQWRDCRRTVQTGMVRIGIPSEIVDRTLNHGVSAIEAAYNHHDYLAEKRAALQKWADYLDGLVAP